MTASLGLLERPVQASVIARPRPTRCSATREEILDRLPAAIAEKRWYRQLRAEGLRGLLEWLEGYPGTDWQERWEATGANTAGPSWGEPGLTERQRSRQASAVTALVVLEAIRPSVHWLRTATPPHLLTTWRNIHALGIYEDVARHAGEQQASRTNRMLAVNTLTVVHITTGREPSEMTVEDFRAVVEAAAEIRKPLKGVELAWHVLQLAGGLPGAGPTYRAATGGAPSDVEALVARYDMRPGPVRDLLVDYLNERSAAIDRSSLQGLVRALVKHFWADIEAHHPEQRGLRLSKETVTEWKGRLRVLPDGRGRSDYLTILMTVRAFYLDVAQWALTDPSRWGPWAVPSPISAADASGVRKESRRRQARMQQRTRTLAPLLPRLVAAAESRLDRASRLLAVATITPEGGCFDLAGTRYVGVARRSHYADGPSRPAVRRADGQGPVMQVWRLEDDAFWAWAVIEVLRLTGARCEELVELTHLSIRRYVQPNGEVVPLVQVAPSKSDRERVIPADPELVAVLARIVRRLRGDDGVVPLVSRRDPLERIWGPPLPHLFQLRSGGRPVVISAATVRRLLRDVAADAGLRDVDGSPIRFTPHDLRRIFATETVNSGLPIHIAQKLLGHLDLNTTQGYVAVYPDAVIRHYREFVANRRWSRPSGEYREPSDAEWAEFEQHFTLRKVALGNCHRPYGTPCIHEHACIRCLMLRVDPAQVPRLLTIETNTHDRLDEARQMGWQGAPTDEPVQRLWQPGRSRVLALRLLPKPVRRDRLLPESLTGQLPIARGA